MHILYSLEQLRAYAAIFIKGFTLFRKSPPLPNITLMNIRHCRFELSVNLQAEKKKKKKKKKKKHLTVLSFSRIFQRLQLALLCSVSDKTVRVLHRF